jgi:hypothetical protein
MVDDTIAPRLYEDIVPRRGYFLLIPWMLIGTVWLRVNTGIDPTVVDVYFGLLVAGAMALVITALIEPRVNRDLAKLKLLPFILMFGLAMVAVYVMFALMAFSDPHVQLPDFNETEYANYMAITILLVAPIETLVFQFIVPKLATVSLASSNLQSLGGILSQVTFAGFHYFTYEGSGPAMFVVFLLGIGFYAVVRSNKVWGLGAAMGLHAGWNLGVTTFNVSIFMDLWGSLLPVP